MLDVIGNLFFLFAGLIIGLLLGAKFDSVISKIFKKKG